MCAAFNERLEGFVRFSTEKGDQIGWITGSRGPLYLPPRVASPSEITYGVRTFERTDHKLVGTDLKPATLNEKFPVGTEVHFTDPVDAYLNDETSSDIPREMIGQTLIVKEINKKKAVVATKNGGHVYTVFYPYLYPGKFVTALFPLKSWVKVTKFDDDPKMIGQVGEVITHCHNGTVEVQLEPEEYLRKKFEMDPACLEPANPVFDRPKFLPGQMVRMNDQSRHGCLNSKIQGQNVGVVYKWSSESHVYVISLRDAEYGSYYGYKGLEEIDTLNLGWVQVISDQQKLMDENFFQNPDEDTDRIVGKKGKLVAECLTKELVVFFPSANRAFALNPASVVLCGAEE